MDAREPAWDEPAVDRPAASGVLLAVLCIALMIGGFVALMVGFDLESGPLYAAGIVLWGLAFLIPMSRRA
ncbi:hypothetical protein Q9R32_04585 [Actinotalea sp. AC32]|nr:hypothetical protein [Actinotalea sp. AC32]